MLKREIEYAKLSNRNRGKFLRLPLEVRSWCLVQAARVNTEMRERRRLEGVKDFIQTRSWVDLPRDASGYYVIPSYAKDDPSLDQKWLNGKWEPYDGS